MMNRWLGGLVIAMSCAGAVAQTSVPTSTPASKPATRATSRPGGEIVAPPRRDVPGKRIKLDAGELYVPTFFVPRDRTDVVIWSLGAAWCVEQSFFDSHRNAVVLTLNEGTRKEIGTAGKFDAVIESVIDALRKENIADKPVGRICAGSFSGGYVTTREMLRNAEIAARITDVVLADSLYAPRKDDALDDAAMKPFLDFAGRAMGGKATFVFSQLYPPESKYRNNTTTLAAFYLTDHLHIRRVDSSEGKSPRGAAILYRAEKGGVHILGYAGMTNQDHFDHLYGMASLLEMTSLEAAP